MSVVSASMTSRISRSPVGLRPRSTSTSPVFLVGSERSGTTLLRLMLDHHPLLAFEFEFEYSVDRVGEDGSLPDLDEYREWLSSHRIYQLRRYAIDRRLSYPQLVHDFLEQRRARVDKPFVGATVHHHFDRLRHIWPGARYIHLLRDGRDVARSVIDMGWAGNTWTAINTWIEAARIWEDLKPKLGSDQYVEVRYEDLVRHPQEVLAEICRFIDIPFDARMLNYPEDSTYGPPDPRLAEQWQRKLSEKAIQLAEARAGDLLVRLGYRLSGLPPIEVDAAMDEELRRQSKRYCRQFRINRFGLPLLGMDYLCRKLKLKPIEKLTRLRLQAIENSHLK